MSAQQTTTTDASVWQRFWAWLPDHVDRRIRVFAWLSFIAEVTIIGTGGAVRLTGSGLGCPTWPLCTPESLVPTPGIDEGIHSLIEFGNRLMTGVVGLIALAVWILVLKLRKERRDLYVLSVVVVGGVAAQAIVGGITVLTGLNPFIVGFHYVSSLALVCVTAAFLVRMSQPAGPCALLVPRWHAVLVHVTSLAMALTIAFGVLTTGAGPHSGDAEAGRNGFNAGVLEHVHAWPGYALFALTVVLLIAGWRARAAAPALLRWTLILLAVELVQIAVGLYQARNGLPELAVGVHMVLAALAAATMTVVVLQLKAPVAVATERVAHS
ncbi:COX15/CtaA family protein [Microbacterium sp. M3]|uniref:COX15/CtaA family protein n=1 Tax=Microbacterium arthrosphaerae TaxID=792652 RepID=A0ABU4GZ62_9MICO|nr:MULTISPECIES: COX15/CtaA family protein [Microbacterium]MDW4572366.1 COX15/CtaA family protein [Microbacterium arthrosphaerae]MDW7606221.1 COX15/CtaA family protein [Microbacterium sp. M3]